MATEMTSPYNRMDSEEQEAVQDGLADIFAEYLLAPCMEIAVTVMAPFREEGVSYDTCES